MKRFFSIILAIILACAGTFDTVLASEAAASDELPEGTKSVPGRRVRLFRSNPRLCGRNWINRRLPLGFHRSGGRFCFCRFYTAKNELLTNCSQFQGKTGLTSLLWYVIMQLYTTTASEFSPLQKNLRRNVPHPPAENPLGKWTNHSQFQGGIQTMKRTLSIVLVFSLMLSA